MKAIGKPCIATSLDAPSVHINPLGNGDSQPQAKLASSPLTSSLLSSHRMSLTPLRSRISKISRSAWDDGDSDHDEARHDRYDAEADAYDSLKQTVMGMRKAGHSFSRMSPRLP